MWPRWVARPSFAGRDVAKDSGLCRETGSRADREMTADAGLTVHAHQLAPVAVQRLHRLAYQVTITRRAHRLKERVGK